MGLRNLSVKKVYDTHRPGDDPVGNFYIPSLTESITYDRGSGYFSSTVLALAARGIAGFIRNKGSMRLLTSPELTPEDAIILSTLADNDIEPFVAEKLAAALGDLDLVSSLIERDHLAALAWMLAEGTLEMRLSVPLNADRFGGMLHFKIGILTDADGDSLSFSGSNNESVGGWLRNIEQIKVFRSWDEEQNDYLQGDQAMFDRYWNGAAEDGVVSISLPRAIRDRLITYAPSDVEELDEVLARLDQAAPTTSKPRSLRPYQQDAIAAWRENHYHGILEMATGTGKTLTSTRGIEEVLSMGAGAVVLVVAPLVFLAGQWKKELDHLSPIMVHGGTGWRAQLRAAKNDLQLGLRDSVVLIAVQNTASTEEFLQLSEAVLRTATRRLIVVDEVHGSGAEQFSNLMSESFDHRLGLSATPHRWCDEEGTERIMEYFGGVVFTFGIHEALHWVDPITGQTPLCPYGYHPMFVELTDDELEQYEALSEQIKNAVARGESMSSSERLKMLLVRRAVIIKRAENKIPTLRAILSDISDFRGTLVYCSDSKQLEQAAEVLNEMGLRYRRFSGEEGAIPTKALGNRSERDVIMEDFESGAVDILLAMKCLDEGVDIPSAKRGIILASSANPREFIQRRGRLLRRSPGKALAEIYDVLVVPTTNAVGDSSEMGLLLKELKRVEEFAQDAVNEIEIRNLIMEKSWEILR